MKKFFIVLMLLICSTLSLACTKIMMSSKDYGTFVSRSEDFRPDAKPTIEVRPKGESYQSKEGVNWTSKYSSAMVSVFGFTFVEGLNEAGLSASALSLDEESGVNLSENKETISNALIVPYIVDNFSTVVEVVENLSDLNVKVLEVNGQKLAGHYMVQDKLGDSAVIELVDNKIKVYHGREYNVMTNSPTYDKQLDSWKSFSERSEEEQYESLPGSYKSDKRFIRSKYNISNMSNISSYENAIVKIHSAIPVVPQLENRSKTQYTVTYNLNKKILHFRYQFADYFTQFEFDFNKMNNGNFYTLNMKNNDLFGSVEEQFENKKGIMELYR